jgi:hypothetical protein
MIYEMRTYTLKPGSTAEFEARFEKRHPFREKHSKLAAFWHTDIGPLNQVIHVWGYNDLNQRAEIRAQAGKDPHWPPKSDGAILDMQSEIFNPAPFMRPLGSRDYGQGNIYEMRSYTYQPGTMPEVVNRWAESIPHREEYSPLAAGMFSELGGLNKWVHIWPYKSLNERNKIRAEASKSSHWPPKTREFLLRQENKILVPAAFSPMK